MPLDSAFGSLVRCVLLPIDQASSDSSLHGAEASRHHKSMERRNRFVHGRSTHNGMHSTEEASKGLEVPDRHKVGQRPFNGCLLQGPEPIARGFEVWFASWTTAMVRTDRELNI